MRVLLLSDINSAHTVKWASGLVSIGMEVKVISIAKPIGSENNFHFEYDTLGLNHSITRKNSSLQKLKYLSFYFLLRKHIKHFQPDIVHAHYASSYGFLSLISLYRPYFLSVWGSDIMEFPKRSIIHKIFLQQILKNAKVIFSTSHFMADIIEKSYNLKASVIPFGIDTEVFTPCKRTTDKLVIGSIKGLEEIYGLTTFFKAFALIQNELTIPIEIQIYGSGSQLNQYQNLCEELKIDKYVKFNGRIDFSKVPVTMASFDLLINLSKRESFGVSVLEASSCGIPILLSDISGLKEVYINGKTAISCQVDNVFDTAEKLKKLINNDALRYEMGCAGRKFVQESYEWIDCLKSLQLAYKDNT